MVTVWSTAAEIVVTPCLKVDFKGSEYSYRYSVTMLDAHSSLTTSSRQRDCSVGWKGFQSKAIKDLRGNWVIYFALKHLTVSYKSFTQHQVQQISRHLVQLLMRQCCAISCKFGLPVNDVRQFNIAWCLLLCAALILTAFISTVTTCLPDSWHQDQRQQHFSLIFPS